MDLISLIVTLVILGVAAAVVAFQWRMRTRTSCHVFPEEASLKCNDEIFTHGQAILILHGSSANIEIWVKRVAKMADARVDWHFFGGRARVLHLGDEFSFERVNNAIDNLLPLLSDDCGVLARYGYGGTVFANVP